MNRKKVYAWSMLVLPWLSAPFLGRQTFIRFLPSAIFANLNMIILSIIANKKKWWINKNTLTPKTPVDFSYILGVHFMTTLWVFKLTFGSFPLYLITNIVIDIINAFPFAGMWEKLGFFKFKRMSPTEYCGLTIFLAIILYIYQFRLEKVINKDN